MFSLYELYHSQLFVSVSPESPVIQLNTTLDALVEGHSVQFNCSTTGGNPIPAITWTRNGEMLLGEKIIDPVKKFGTTSSVLTMQLTRNDHRANFSCHVTNRAINGSPKVKTQQIFVKCKHCILNRVKFASCAFVTCQNLA